MLYLGGSAVILLVVFIPSSQFILSNNKLYKRYIKQEQLSFHSSPSYQEDKNPSCERNCTELNPDSAYQNCPALQRGLTCGKYNVYHYHRQCSIATIYCRRNLTNVREVAVYVAATGTDLNKNKSGLFVLPYLDRKDLFVPLLVVEKPHHGNGGKGELVCGSNGKWILYDINYRYEVEHLFCLVVEARNLNYLMDLAHPELKRVTPVVPFRRNDPEFFEFAK